MGFEPTRHKPPVPETGVSTIPPLEQREGEPFRTPTKEDELNEMCEVSHDEASLNSVATLQHPRRSLLRR